MKLIYRCICLFIIAAMFGLFLNGCFNSQSDPDNSSQTQVNVTISLTIPDYHKLSARVIDPATSSLEITVTAADMTAVTKIITSNGSWSSGSGTISGNVQVPVGTARHFSLVTKDNAGNPLTAGSATVDVVAGTNPPLQFHLLPEAGITTAVSSPQTINSSVAAGRMNYYQVHSSGATWNVTLSGANTGLFIFTSGGLLKPGGSMADDGDYLGIYGSGSSGTASYNLTIAIVATPTPTSAPTSTITPSPTPNNTPTPTPNNTPTPTPTRTPTPKPTNTPTPTPVPMGEIAGGTGSYKDNDWISFGKTFSAVPVIVVNAHDASGRPLIAGVRTESGLAPDKTGFTLKLHDLDNNVVTTNATVQWVAIIPNYSSLVAIQAKTDSYRYDGEYIAFDHSFSAPYPIIICTAYDDSMAYPIIAAPYSISANGFTISLKDADGNPSTASVHWIALVPPSNYNYYKEVSMVASYTMYNNNGSVLFDLTRNADAVLCSAQKNNFAYSVAARNNSRYGFDLGLLDYDGTAGTSVWTSWLALGFK